MSVARVRHAPDDDVEDLLLLVDLADLLSLDKRGRCAADIAGRQAEARGGIGPQPHFDLRHQHLRLDLQIGHAGERLRSLR